MRNYVFINKINDYDSFTKNVIYIDIETTDDITKIDTDTLNAMNAKLIVVGSYEKLYFDTGKFPEFREEQRENIYLYLNRISENTNADRLAEFLLHILEKNTEIKRVIAFNGARFDFLILKKVKKIREYNRCVALINHKRPVSLIDIVCLSRAMGYSSLNSFTKAMTGNEKSHHDNIYEYCIHDVYILMKACEKLENVYNYTPTRTSRLFLARWLSGKNIVSQCPTVFDYAGGRVSVFRYRVENTIYHYDLNSLYPFTMAKMKHPALYDAGNSYRIKVSPVSQDSAKRYIHMLCSLYDESKNIYDMLYELNAYMNTYLFSKIRIKAVKKDTVFPYSFIDSRKRRVYMFMPGQEYWIYGYEHAFLKYFDFEIVESYAAYAEYLPYAREIEKLYIERQRLKEAGDSRELLLKIVLNASYGVFGLRNPVKVVYDSFKTGEELQNFLKKHGFTVDTTHIPDELFSDNAIANILKTHDMHSQVYHATVKFITKTFSFLSSPPLAISITSNARFILHAYIYHLHTLGFDTYYCDTDSLFTNAPPESIVSYISRDLGYLKHENTYQKAIFLAPKTYIAVSSSSSPVVKAKGTGDSLEKTFVQQSYRTDFRVITRKFIDENSVPAFIPVDNIPVYNTHNIAISQHDEYMKLITEFTQLYHQIVSE